MPSAKDSSLCEKCKKIRRISAGLRVCTCGKEMKYGERASCAACAKKNGTCCWCGKKKS